jgi:hypothetical protein
MLFHGCLQDRSKTPNLPWKLQWKQERISLEDVTVMAPQNNWGWLLKSIRPATNLSRSEVVHIFLEMSPWIWTTKLTQKPFKIPTANPSDRVWDVHLVLLIGSAVPPTVAWRSYGGRLMSIPMHRTTAERCGVGSRIEGKFELDYRYCDLT